MENKFYTQLRKKATNLVQRLERECTEETICENYGQEAIKKFKDENDLSVFHTDRKLSYSEICNIQEILERVKDITPITLQNLEA